MTIPTLNASRTERNISSGSSAVDFLRRLGPLPVILVLMVVVFQLGNPRFLSLINVTNMGQQAVFLALIAVGQMVVLVAGGFDLSVGSVVALTSVVTAKIMVALALTFPGNEPLVILLGGGSALLVGIACGLINGLGVSVLKVNAFIVTLATASIFRGVTLLISQGVQIGNLPQGFVFGVGSGQIAGIPVLVIMSVVPLVLVVLLMHRMRFGKYLYAIGSNVRAAIASGINVNVKLIGAYVLCSTITAYAGWLLTARVSTGEPLLGAEFPLNSIAAAVIGGCSLRGGEGSVPGVLMGVAFITILANGMDLMRIGSNYQMIVLGIVLLSAVVLDRFRNQ